MNMKKMPFLKCPFCSHLAMSFMVKKDNRAYCFNCSNTFDSGLLKPVMKNVEVEYCNDCNLDVSITHDNRNGADTAYICPKCLKPVR